MQTIFTVENLVVKYRNYVKEHCSKSSEFDGVEMFLVPISPSANADEQLIATLYKRVAKGDVDVRITEVLSKYVESFFYEALTTDEISFLCEHFSEVISYEFTHRDNWSWSSINKDYVSTERIKLVKENVGYLRGANVYISDAECCDVAILFPDCNIYGFTGGSHNHEELWALGQIRLYAAGIKSHIVSGEDDGRKYTYTLPPKGSMDIVIFRANGDKIHGESIYGTGCKNVEELYDLLKPNGKLLFFVDSKAEMATADQKDIASFRRRIVEDKSITTIVEYEDKELFGFSEEKDSYLLLIIEKAINEEVLFRDDRTNMSFTAKAEALCSDILWPSYYRTWRPKNGIPLSRLVKYIDSTCEHEMLRLNDSFILPEEMKKKLVVVPSKMAKDYKDANLLTRNLEQADSASFDLVKRLLMQSIKEPCVLLFGKADRFVVGYIDMLPDSGIVSLHGMVRLKPQASIDVRYIAALLLSPEVKSQIVSICQGEVDSITFPLILDKIMVPNHTEKERLEFLSETNYAALQSSQKEMEQNKANYIKAVRMRKHALTQSLSSVEAMFYALNAYRIRNDGHLTDADVISRVQGTTVKDAFEFLSKEIKDMMPVLEHIADVEYSFASPVSIDPEEFIENYIKKEEKGWLNFKPVTAWASGNNKAKHDIVDNEEGILTIKKGAPLSTFVFPPDALDKVFNNILSNAQSYAFTEESRKNYQLKFSWHTDGISLVIEIENNGTPIPDERDTTSLLEYGVSSALHQDGHNGIGCNEIADIMSRYDGNVEIVSTPDEEYTVKYVLTFNNTFTYRPKQDGKRR